jgi:hypothetical protein
MKLSDLNDSTLVEAFTDLGKLSDKELAKGQKLKPGDDNFSRVEHRLPFSAIRLQQPHRIVNVYW